MNVYIIVTLVLNSFIMKICFISNYHNPKKNTQNKLRNLLKRKSTMPNIRVETLVKPAVHNIKWNI